MIRIAVDRTVRQIFATGVYDPRPKKKAVGQLLHIPLEYSTAMLIGHEGNLSIINIIHDRFSFLAGRLPDSRGISRFLPFCSLY